MIPRKGVRLARNSCGFTGGRSGPTGRSLHEGRNPVMVYPMLANLFIGVGLQIFADERPEIALREFLHGLPKKGAKGRDFDEQIEIAAAVERLRPRHDTHKGLRDCRRGGSPKT